MTQLEHIQRLRKAAKHRKQNSDKALALALEASGRSKCTLGEACDRLIGYMHACGKLPETVWQLEGEPPRQPAINHQIKWKDFGASDPAQDLREAHRRWIDEARQSLEPMVFNEEYSFVLTPAPEIRNFLATREVISHVREIPVTKTDRPIACEGCANYHGQAYGRDLFHCAIHPYGPDSTCEDFKC